ncbi:MAG: hypothetical protein A2Y33_02765 [Spirochaetes bacterium GWF1_51_8]|nr:MAG: hypothetical protein A2Y33_02765 [Spirochaetes bacterium GWF1_51_8]
MSKAASIFSLILLFTVSSCGLVPLYYGNTFQPFVSDFEDGTTGVWGLEQGRPGLIAVVTNPVRTGTYAVKFTILPGVTWGSGNRTEMKYFNIDPYGEEVYYGWSCMLAPGYTDNGLWQIIGQWHDQPDPFADESWSSFPKNSPPLSINYTSNRVYLVVIHSGIKNKTMWEYGVPVGYGQWFDVAVHVKWSMLSDGFVEAWINGTNLYPERIYCPTVVNRIGNYLKIGLYRDENAQGSNVVYYDNVKIGKTLTEVQP